MVKSQKILSAFALGNYFLSFDGTSWTIPDKLKFLDNITCAANRNESEIYLVNRAYPLNYSKLFFFNGNSLREIPHPFGNEIVSMHLDRNNTLWLGGDREIAKQTVSGWEYISYPPTQYAAGQIFSDAGKQIWVKTTLNELFFFNGTKWIQKLANENVKQCYFINEDSVLALTDEKLVLLGKDNTSILHSNKLLSKTKSILYQSKNSILGFGDKGFLIHFDNAGWKKLDIPLKENINSISLINGDEIFIACDDGIIAKLSRQFDNSKPPARYGFQPIQPIRHAKDLDDEYGAGIADLNGDGYPDIYSVCIYEPNRLYLNQIPKKKQNANLFSESAVDCNATGVDEKKGTDKSIPKLQLGLGLADIDNDGDPDIFITSLIGKSKLLLNDGSGKFRDVSANSGREFGASDRTNAALFADVNNDGNLDLFLVNEYSSNRLYLNNGNGYFRDVTLESGVASLGGSNGAVFADADNDGRPDLFICNWGRPNNFYRNISTDKSVRFEKISFIAEKDSSSSKSNSASFADIDNDGRLDLFIANRGRLNRLYKNLGKFKFADVTEEMLGSETHLSYSSTFADFDNDGYQDLFVTNVGKSVFYRNIMGKKFEDVTLEYGVLSSGYGTGSAAGDIDNDGDVDLYAAYYVDGSSTLFINRTNNKNFIEIDIEGTVSNRDAIGTKVWLYDASGGRFCGYREISGGSGYSSVNLKQIHFGVDSLKKYFAVVFFPASGKKIYLTDLRAASRIKVSEETGFDRTLTLVYKSAARIINDPEIQLEAAEFLIVLMLILFSAFTVSRKYKWPGKIIFLTHSVLLLFYVFLFWSFLHEAFVLSTIIPFASVIIGIFLLHLFYDRIILAKRIKEERQTTRDKIARDLHDDLASTISSGLIYADILNRNIKEGSEDKTLARNISSLLNEASESITDLVWSVSPSHDSLQDLIARLRFHISAICESSKIKCNIETSLNNKAIVLNDEIRKNIFFVFKEAIRNTINHSSATEVAFSVYEIDGSIELRLRDNGKGMSPEVDSDLLESSAHGNGLKNMKKRAEEIGAKLQIISSPSQGTEISLKIEIAQTGY